MLILKKASVPFFLLILFAGVLFSSPISAQPDVKLLYDRLGGEDAITDVVDDFVGRAAADPAVNFTRVGKKRIWEATPENVAILKKHLVQFLCMATGGTQIYEGKDMVAAHKDLEITDAEFDALAADLKTSLDKIGVPARERDELMAIAGSTRGSVVETKIV